MNINERLSSLSGNEIHSIFEEYLCYQKTFVVSEESLLREVSVSIFGECNACMISAIMLDLGLELAKRVYNIDLEKE